MITRIIDTIVAVLTLLVFSPILLLIPILIKLDDGGPVFFKQQRLGLNRKLFTVWKFRSMRDEKVTRVGKFLRASALDEFLQFFSILKGEMSVVGPRPLTENDVARLGWDTDQDNRRWDVVPGLTGLVQLYGGQSAAHSRMVEAYYSQHRCALLNLKIMALSGLVNFFGKKRVKTWFPLKNFDTEISHGSAIAAGD